MLMLIGNYNYINVSKINTVSFGFKLVTVNMTLENAAITMENFDF